MANVVTSRVNHRDTYRVEFLLSFSGDGFKQETTQPPLPVSRDVEIDCIDGSNEQLKKELEDNLIKFFAGINEFSTDYVNVVVTEFEKRGA